MKTFIAACLGMTAFCSFALEKEVSWDGYILRGSRAVAAGFSSVTQNFGGVPNPFTINQTIFNFYSTADCTGAKLNSSVNYTVNGAGHTFTAGDAVRYDGASAWSQASASGVADPTQIGSMQFIFCGHGGYCSLNGGFKCFSEVCAGGVCTTPDALTATTVG